MVSPKYFWLAVGLVSATVVMAGDSRTWTDVSGKFNVEAEMISLSEGNVILRSTLGKETTVPLEKLSKADREYVRVRMKQDEIRKDSPQLPSASLGKNPDEIPMLKANESKSKTSSKSQKSKSEIAADLKTLREKAELFYNDLRNNDRREARGLLTEVGQKLVEANESALKEIPVPDNGASSLQIGKAKISRTVAMVPVQVKLGGDFQQTALHLRKEEDEWSVFAISALVGGNELTISFEASVAGRGQQGDPLASLVGKPLEVIGATLDGRPISSSAYLGKVILIDFWATWCGPCRKEMPNILENYNKYQRAGFEVIAVSQDQDLEELKDFLITERPPWPVVAGYHPQKRMMTSPTVEITSIPTFILLGRDGKVAEINCRGDDLGKALSRLLAP